MQLIKIIERLIENGKYIRISIEIDGVMKAVEAQPTEKGIELLQSFIDERRALTVLELNFFHKKSAAKLSTMYKERIL